LRQEKSIEQRVITDYMQDISKFCRLWLSKTAVIANLVMEDVEQRALASVPVSLSFWKRFVDDVISAVSRNEIDILQQHLNSIEPSIQFTVEREINGHLAFLDLNVHRTVEGKLETDVIANPDTETNTCHTTLITR
jgi:hypothetical protein